ncbi:hypothetical protein ACJX0J_011570, partial [Zea mays]
VITILFSLKKSAEMVLYLPFSIVEELSIIHPIFFYLGQSLVFKLENSLIMYFIKICLFPIISANMIFLFQNHFLELSIPTFLMRMHFLFQSFLFDEFLCMHFFRGLILGLLPRVGIEFFKVRSKC